MGLTGPGARWIGPLCSVLGVLILGEAVHWIQVAGAALVLAGVTLATLRSVRPRDPAIGVAAGTGGS